MFNKEAVFAVLCSVSIWCGLVERAAAQRISGAIGFTGAGSATTSGGTNTLTFNNPMTVDLRVGAWGNIPIGTPADFAPISWSGSGFGTSMLTSSNIPEWSIYFGGTGYLFSILTVQSAVLVPGFAVSLSGIGLAVISGAITREPTYTNWSIQGYLDPQGFSSNLIFTADTVQVCNITCPPPLSVPDTGSAFACLAASLAGIAVLRWRWLSHG